MNSHSVSKEKPLVICWFLWDDSFNMAAKEGYAPEKVQFNPGRQYVKKHASKFILIESTNIHIFHLTYSKKCIVFEDFVFEKRRPEIQKLLIVLQ